ncbi:hypothetical protein BJV74DRAFT_840797 [Russula compacta]|nr:hypothetical protein BJV74DRAFT_862750 [Russula compacta]KAH9987736.1 hypothetical protein BJV74DRAFT_840797 [Russula compacta]
MHLQNVVMQLRKVYSHPFLIDWPLDLPAGPGRAAGRREREDDGPRAAPAAPRRALFARGKNVLVFLQFITILDIVEEAILIPTVLHLLTVACNGRTGRASLSTGHCAA